MKVPDLDELLSFLACPSPFLFLFLEKKEDNIKFTQKISRLCTCSTMFGIKNFDFFLRCCIKC